MKFDLFIAHVQSRLDKIEIYSKCQILKIDKKFKKKKKLDKTYNDKRLKESKYELVEVIWIMIDFKSNFIK